MCQLLLFSPAEASQQPEGTKRNGVSSCAVQTYAFKRVQRRANKISVQTRRAGRLLQRRPREERVPSTTQQGRDDHHGGKVVALRQLQFAPTPVLSPISTPCPMLCSHVPRPMAVPMLPFRTRILPSHEARSPRRRARSSSSSSPSTLLAAMKLERETRMSAFSPAIGCHPTPTAGESSREKKSRRTHRPPLQPPSSRMNSAWTAVMRARFSRSARCACNCASCACRCASWRGLIAAAAAIVAVVPVAGASDARGAGAVGGIASAGKSMWVADTERGGRRWRARVGAMARCNAV